MPSADDVRTLPAPAKEARAAWSALPAVARETLAPFRDALAPVAALAPHVGRLLAAHPDVALRCLEGDPDGALRDALPSAEVPIARRLRVAKARVALVCALCDLLGTWPTLRVTQALSDFADEALALALDAAVRPLARRGKLRLGDDEAVTGIGIVAMGKHGAGELNYSSDIDVVVLFDPDAAIFPDRAEALDAAVRTTRELVRLMQERTADGYVFRTDLRLRPDPGSMPLAIPLPMAEIYYETRGQNWERAAWIKARHAAGDPAVTAAVLAALRPFVWRRYLDFAAISDIHSIKRQIQAHRDITDLQVPGHNVKLGRGGIREIEFFVQTQQLIAGGRDARLRGRATLPMLRALAETGWIAGETARELSESYLYLRDVEHRLQMVDDRQTHTLPGNRDGLRRIGALMGKDARTFERELNAHLVRTERHYARLFADEPTLAVEGNLAFTGDDPDPDTVRTLAGLGFERPEGAVATIKGWHFGRAPAMRSAAARERLTALMPQLVDAFARTGRPDEAALSFDAFLAGLPAGVQLFALLDANPKLTRLLLDVLFDAPRMARIVQRSPHVLDAVIEPRFFADLPTGDDLAAALRTSLDQAADYEACLDRARLFAAEQRFLVSLRMMGGTIDANEAGRAYALLAETVLAEMLERVRDRFAERHGRVPGARFAVIAMGRLGSRELTAASDLDLIFVVDRPDPNAMSDGAKSLAAAQYDMRLVQQLIAATSAPTAQGRLYELDFRLRPSGNSGPLATTFAAFRAHQEERAKAWEHLALTRARSIAGDAALRDEIDRTVREVVSRPRDRRELAREVRDMRALMDRERPARHPWDVKLAPGGLVDAEFIAQFAVLAGLVSPHERLNGVGPVLRAMGEGAVAEDYALFTAVMQFARLALEREDDAPPEGLRERMAARFDGVDAANLLATLDERRRRVRAAFERIVR